MKWTNKGHELDEYANEVVRLFDERKGKVYLFGAGLIGGDTEVILEHILTIMKKSRLKV